MNYSGKKMKQSSFCLLLTCVAFLFYIMLTPYMYNQTIEAVSVISSPSAAGDWHTPSKNSGHVSFITTAITEYELFTDAVSNQFVCRIIQESRQFYISSACLIAALLVGYGFLLRYRKCFIYQSCKHKSIMTISFGGHAPPCESTNETLLY